MSGRYHRHEMLSEIGVAGQRALRRGSALVVGCGALGSSVVQVLARSGVGRLVLADGDQPTLENLHRQLGYDERSLVGGRTKSLLLGELVSRLNREVEVEVISRPVVASELRTLVSAVDVVFECTDSYQMKLDVNSSCVANEKRLVIGAVEGVRGQVFSSWAGVGPCYGCVMGAMGEGQISDGIYGPSAVLAGVIQASEGIRQWVSPSRDHGRWLDLDLWRMVFDVLEPPRELACPLCGSA